MIEDLLFADGQDNDAGLAEEHYYALRSDIETFPTLAANPLTNSERAKLIGNYVMKSGKYFRKLYCTLETGSVVSTQVGERDGKSYENIATLFFPSDSTTLRGFLEAMKNSKIILLVRQLDGSMLALGSEYISAELSANELTTGSQITDRKGATYSIRSIGRIAPFYYEAGETPEKLPPLEPPTP